MAFEDLMPGKTKKRPLKRRNGEDTPPPPPMQEPEPMLTVRVRMLRTVSSRFSGRHLAGQTAILPANVAREWIAEGLAELDKMLDGPPETKAI